MASALALVFLSLSGCGAAPDFVAPPPAAYHVPIGPELEGVWAREGPDNGERARLSGAADGALRIEIFTTRASSQEFPDQPLMAQLLHFDETNWLLLDMHKLSALTGDTYEGAAPYRLIRYVLESPGRLCASEPSAQLFLEGINAGRLQGSVTARPGGRKHVTVSSAGEDWVAWWRALPASAKGFSQPAYCFTKMD